MASPEEAAALVGAAQSLYLSRLTSGAAATLVLYDWCLVFGREYDTMYHSKWSIPKALFVFIRLITPPGVVFGSIQLVDFRPALSEQAYALFCGFAITFLTYAMLTSIFAAHGLFTLRLIALYKGTPLMVWFIAGFYIATYIATYGVTIGAIIAVNKFPIYYSDMFHACATLATSPLLPPIWYAPAAYETFVFGLTVYRAWRDALLMPGTLRSPLLVIFYRDGMIAFVAMTGIRAWNIWIYLTQPLSGVYVGAMLMWAANTVLTTRVYINLVWAARKPMLSTFGDLTSAGMDFRAVTEGGHPEESIVMRTPNNHRARRPGLKPGNGSSRRGPTASDFSDYGQYVAGPVDDAAHGGMHGKHDIRGGGMDQKTSAPETADGEGTAQSLDLPVDSWRSATRRLDPAQERRLNADPKYTGGSGSPT